MPIVVSGGATRPHLARVSQLLIGPVSVLRAVAICQTGQARPKQADHKQGHNARSFSLPAKLASRLPSCGFTSRLSLCLTASAASHCHPSLLACHSLHLPSLNSFFFANCYTFSSRTQTRSIRPRRSSVTPFLSTSSFLASFVSSSFFSLACYSRSFSNN